MIGRAMAWCGAGLATIVLMAVALADARELLSDTEILWSVRFDEWSAFREAGVEGVSWSLVLTPRAAVWGLLFGGLLAWVGWDHQRRREALPFGWLGGAIWLTGLGQFLAESLLAQFALLTLQALCCGLWWARQISERDQAVHLRSWLGCTLLGDVCGLWGVLLAGLAWRTLSSIELSDSDVLQAGWRTRSMACSLAGLLMFGGILTRGGLFPFLAGTRIACELAGSRCALVFSCCLWRSLLWHISRIAPLLGIAPETVALIQGMSLLAAGAATFVATGQREVNRIIFLLSTSQIAMLLSVAAFPSVLSPTTLLLNVMAIGLSSMILFRPPPHRLPRLLAWWLMAGSCFSPIFWTSAQAATQFEHWPTESIPPPDTGHLEIQAHEDDTQSSASYRVRPLPVTTWTAVWCLVSCCGTFAGYRGCQLSAVVNPQETRNPPSFSHSLTHSALTSMFLIACATGSGWQALSGGVNPLHWPIVAAMVSGLFGGMLAIWIDRHPARHDEKFQPLGQWSSLAIHELRVPEFSRWLRDRLFDPLVRLAGVVDRWLSFGAGRSGSRLSRWITQTAEELRNESDVFYAVSLVTTVGSLIVTWWALAG